MYKVIAAYKPEDTTIAKVLLYLRKSGGAIAHPAPLAPTPMVHVVRTLCTSQSSVRVLLAVPLQLFLIIASTLLASSLRSMEGDWSAAMRSVNLGRGSVSQCSSNDV